MGHGVAGLPNNIELVYLCTQRDSYLYLLSHVFPYDIIWRIFPYPPSLCLTRSWRLIGPSISWKTLRFFRTRRKEKPRWDDRETVRWLDIEHRWIYCENRDFCRHKSPGWTWWLNHQTWGAINECALFFPDSKVPCNAMLVVSLSLMAFSWQNPVLYSDRPFVSHWDTRDFPHGFHSVGNHHFPHVL